MKQPMHMQLFELWTLAPQVISTRLFRMASASGQPTKSDFKEINDMWSEKAMALFHAGNVMAVETTRFQANLLTQFMSHAMTPATLPQAMAQATFEQGPKAAQKMTENMLKPFHSKVKSNARRLRK